MDLVLEVRTGRERVTVACHGKLVGGKEAEAFRRSVLLLMEGFDSIAINLAGIRAVDCGGLGSLAADKHKEVRILNAAPLVAEQLRLTRLEEFLAPAESNAQPEAAPQPVRATPRAAVA
jgi:anti-anti-sigma regulatory factor